jgi:hypothetical protein
MTYTEPQTGHVDSDDLQRLDNVLADTATPSLTRKALITRAALGAAGVGALGALGPIPAALAKGSGSESITSIVNAAVTAEALAVTYLTGLIENAKATGVTKFVDVLKAANAAEYDHYNALRSLGAKPLTLKFWAPDAFFKPGEPFKVLEFAETQFVNAYLIHVTATAKAGMDKAARYGAEILGTEAQHLALARFAQGKLPNNVGFMQYKTHTIGGIVANLEHAGIGFGKRGKGPGRFYHYHRPPHHALARITDNKPR